MTSDCKKLTCGEDNRFPRNRVSGLIVIARYHYEQLSSTVLNLVLFFFIIIILLFYAYKFIFNL